MHGFHVSFPELRDFYNYTEISKAESIIKTLKCELHIHHNKFEMTSKYLSGGIFIPV